MLPIVVLLVAVQSDNSQKNISIQNIRFIKIKRNAVVKGLGYGLVVGGIVGYAVGYVTYNDDSQYYEDNSGDQEFRARGGAIVGAVPGAVIGSIRVVFLPGDISG